MKKVIIQCCGRKNPSFLRHNGIKVKFVVHPEQCESRQDMIYFRPEDPKPDADLTWRQYLITYNDNHRNHRTENPHELLAASNLYIPGIYQRLAEDNRWETYILSAGWGLVKSDFLLPFYDITFKRLKASDCFKRRCTKDRFEDINELVSNRDDVLYFFGTKDYLPLYYKLTRDLPGRKAIYYVSKQMPKEIGYEYIPYNTTKRTNWHYDCARDFIQGNVSK